MTEIPLTEGTLLALYTDGLVETPGADLAGAITRLAQHLAAADDQDLDLLIDHLLDKADTSGQRTDDIALLVLRHETHGAQAE
ncbi:serine/threonine-protein phosphatase [Streptomyces cinnabarinus]|uniref:Serine/threonine-protein phosphatase n=1 Tax=Streptomyces cinnabarinus TaxID=67287 RepID=A0ABY7K7J4_9ACTN|nr:SpoIIE family protein phosphatase [Streptomyces cinnabarinus]WAZ19132.1 serine/threonine-protein phosphatase [Streptomyces cinnabarinus]